MENRETAEASCPVTESPLSRRALRGIIHGHSRFSPDSLTPVSCYLRVAARQALDFILLTDHDTTTGSAELRGAAAKQMPNLCVPLAAEYSTDQGDIIVAFLVDEIRSRSYEGVVRAAREQSAMVLLPHPYVSHPDPERQALDCDLIEVFNSRACARANALAAALAAKLGKPAYAAADSHFSRNIANAILEVEVVGGVQKSLQYGRMRWSAPRSTPTWEVEASQFVKAWKARRPGSAAYRLATTLRNAARAGASRLFPQTME